MPSESIRRARDALAEASALLVCAGAGMGVDSGLPDFRGNEGFWRAYPPFARLGLSFMDLANPSWFRRDPELAWGFYGHRLNLYRKTEPHPGFAALLRFGEALPAGVFVFTSNVDGQFQMAGFSEDGIVECHGSIHHLQCSRPCRRAIWPAANEEVTIDEDTFRAAPPLPPCPSCGEVARPNILMFGDWAWIPDRSTAQEDRFESWLDRAGTAGLVIIEIGAGSAVPTVRMLSERTAASTGATLIRINPREPQLPHGQIGLGASATEALSELGILGPEGP